MELLELTRCVLCRRGHRKPRSPALQMVEEKARIVLKKSEFTTLAYYQEEYTARQMTIEAFVAVLLELLNTPEKVTFHFVAETQTFLGESVLATLIDRCGTKRNLLH